MIKALLLALLLVGCRDGGLVQVGECGKPCYPFKGAAVGECHTGLLYCDDDGGTSCEGAVGPGEEVCDGLDNNCDGQTDELTGDIPGCQTPCGYGFWVCRDGGLTCTARQPVPEERGRGFDDCDNQDNDCDGLTDEAQDFPIEFCYDGDPTQLTYSTSQCRPGIKRCAGLHKWMCVNETLPRPETCNGKDDNCNGEVDEGADGGAVPVDLIVIMDNSASMAGYQFAAEMATSSWAVKYGARPEVRFALVFAPDNMFVTMSRVVLKQNFTDPATFNLALAQSNINGSGGEPTLDALTLLADSQNPLHLSWNPSLNTNRVIVMYSDEEPQSYFSYTDYGADSGYTMIADVDAGFVAQRCAQEGLKVYIFTNPYDSTAWSGWFGVSNATGGQTYSIQSSAYDIETQLDKIIQSGGCLP
jgi:hypothetical protein